MIYKILYTKILTGEVFVKKFLMFFLISFTISFIISLFLGGCATIRDWDKKLAQQDILADLKCKEMGGKTLHTQILPTGHKVYWCCNEIRQQCNVIDEATLDIK